MFNFAQGQERRSRLGGINRRNTLSILRIALKLHFVPKFEPVDKSRSSGTQKLGERGCFAKVSKPICGIVYSNRKKIQTVSQAFLTIARIHLKSFMGIIFRY